MIYYCIDLDSKCPKVLEYSGDALKNDMEFLNVSNALEIADYDRKVFKTELEAENYLTRYNLTKSKLKELCVKRGSYPTLLYKTRYLVQTLHGEKLQTFRDSPHVNNFMRNVKPGDFFNLTTQTYTHTVQLKKRTKIGKKWRYDFTECK